MENLKQLAQTVESKLTSKSGFRALHGGGLFGGRAKRSFAIWAAAQKKAVLPLYLIQDYVYRDGDSSRYYGIYAFSTQGEIDADTLARLRTAVREIELGTVRLECMGYLSLQLWRGEGQAFVQEHNSIATSLSDVENGLFVYPQFNDADKNNLDRPLVVYARTDEGDHIYPIKRARLQKL